MPLASIVPLYLLFVLGLLPRYNWELFYLSLRRTNVGLGSSFSNPLHHTLRTIITVTTTVYYYYYYYYLQLLFALGPSYQNDKKNILKRKNHQSIHTLHYYYSTQHAAGTMSVLERLREVFNLRAFAEEVRYTHTLSYSFVNSGPVSQPFSLSVSLSLSCHPSPSFFSLF